MLEFRFRKEYYSQRLISIQPIVSFQLWVELLSSFVNYWTPTSSNVRIYKVFNVIKCSVHHQHNVIFV